jgi:Beta-ketoacyl synthase, N-terminal domain
MDVKASCASSPIYIRAAGGVVATASGVVDAAAFGQALLGVDAKPVALRAQAAQVAPQVSRMASRFSQLAVLGAADCLRRLERAPASEVENTLDADTRIYLATGLGDVAHTDALYYGVMPPRSEMPPPARFATSGNNMAAFFVARQAGLASRNLTLSQAELSLECALELALSDFAAGAMRSALIGGVDETTLPREFYTRRFHVGMEQVIGEGSGWLLLDAVPGHGGVRALGAILGACVMPSPTTPDPKCLIDQVRRASQVFGVDALRTSRLVVLPGTGIAADELMALQREPGATGPAWKCHDYLGWSGRFPTAAAVAIVAMFGPIVEHGREGLTCLHVNRDTSGRTGVIAFEVYRSSR